jgi:hypothetical protein
MTSELLYLTLLGLVWMVVIGFGIYVLFGDE